MATRGCLPVCISENGCSVDDQVSSGGITADDSWTACMGCRIRAVREAIDAGWTCAVTSS
jgi:beta-glucosidase/6-phospho-beta-glucosidase/beta-galactosidase